MSVLHSGGMGRALLGTWAAGFLLLVFGCVPYQTYRDTEEKLRQARDANQDLTKRYNELVMRKLRGTETADAGELNELRAKLVRLERENEELRKRPIQPSFTEEEIQRAGGEPEEGGLRLSEDLLFAEGSAALKPTAFRTLDRVIDLLRSDKYRDEKIILEGHTDNQPLDKTKERWKYNMRLGYERAHAVFEYLVAHGIPEDRIVIYDYSYNKPTNPADADTKEGRTRNRRVVVRRAGTRI